MRPQALPDVLYLWWLTNPPQPQWVGTLRSVRKAQQQVAGVSLRYSPHWLQHGMALSEDLPLRDVEFMPQQTDSAAGGRLVVPYNIIQVQFNVVFDCAERQNVRIHC